MAIDYSKRFKDYARFTPAISEMYDRYIHNKNPKRRMPAGMIQQDLDYLDSNSPLFYLPNSLYSAGQAAKSDGAADKGGMVTDRDRVSTIILGDSGGFQIQMGSIKFKGDETRNRMMKWMERNCDWSMILDFPTGGINMGTIQRHYERLVSTDGILPALVKDKNGKLVPALNEDGSPKMENVVSPDYGNRKKLESLMDEHGIDAEDEEMKYFFTCLLQTLINNDYFVKHRTPGATKFLNVVQGRNEIESKIWYEKVKHYPFEGWSLAGPHKENFYMTLHRLIDMRDDGVLQDRDWLHFLGVGKLEHGCVYTTIQRMIREHINPNFTISYDVSSPFTTAAFGNLFLGYTLDNQAWTIQSAKVEDMEYSQGGLVEREGVLIGKVPRGRRATAPLMHIIQEAWDDKMLEEAAVRKELIYDSDHWDGNTTSLAEEIRTKSRLISTEIAGRLTMEDLCPNVDVKYMINQHRYELAKRHGLCGNLTLSERPTFEELAELGDASSLLSDDQLLEATDGFSPSTENREQVLSAIKAGGKFTSSWDVVSYALMMNHNVQVHLEAVFESQDLYDRGDPSRVPADLLKMKEVIEEVFTCEKPHEVIEKNRKVLTAIAGDAAEGGVVIRKDIRQTGNQTYKAQHAAFKDAIKPPPPPRLQVTELFDF